MYGKRKRTTTARLCRKRKWHLEADCEYDDPDEPRRFKRLRSGLLNTRERDAPAAQKAMKRNSTVSPLLSLPPEIRNRIYDLVLGGQMLWISYNFHERHDIIKGRLKKIHTGFKLDQKVQIGFLRVCRQIYGEAALLPYALNKFIFRTDCVRRKFEKITRPAQKRAVGKYEIGYYTGSSKLKKSIISSTSNVPRPPPTHAMRVKDRVSCEESISKTSNIPRPPSYAEWVKNH